MKTLSDRTLRQLREAIALPDLSGTKYRMIRPIAAGGMGEVYLVEDTALERRVALKASGITLFPEELARRMLREARIVARLEHPSIVPVHDVGMLPDGRPFFTMKYVQGSSLDEYIGTSPPLPDLLRTFHRICEAVAFAHAHGVIHRDLKPGNIMVGRFGEVLLMDWGIAKVLRDFSENSAEPAADTVGMEDASATSPPENMDTARGTVLGTPPYMSPEQARGDAAHVDERADIHALGAILYVMLTGGPPASGPPAPPRQIDRTIPHRLEAICLKAIAPAPEQRYDTAATLGEDVLRFLDGLPVSAYRENALEKGMRWAARNSFVLLLILAYLLMRLVVFLAVGN